MSDQEIELQRQLAECTLQKSYLYSVGCVLVSIPVSLRLKSYNPLAIGVLTGTMLDLLNGTCRIYFCLGNYQAFFLPKALINPNKPLFRRLQQLHPTKAGPRILSICCDRAEVV
jgi:hypothetical protein